MRVIRIVPNVVSEAFLASREFYSALFDMEVSVSSTTGTCSSLTRVSDD
jgi:hypothetical protein